MKAPATLKEYLDQSATRDEAPSVTGAVTPTSSATRDSAPSVTGEAELREVLALFYKFDYNSNGFVDRQELATALERRGLRYSSADLDKMYAQYASSDAGIDIEGFKLLVGSTGLKPEKGLEDAMDLFFKYDSDRTGQIDKVKFKSLASDIKQESDRRTLLQLASAAVAVTVCEVLRGSTVVEPITMTEVVAVQKEWGDAIVRISKTWLAGGDYVGVAAKAADELYGYGRADVLFKPTKASVTPFRPTGTEAMSYFVGGKNIEGGYAEDKGFALGPGGVGWKKVIFDNNKVDFNGGTAQAMGEYYFYSAADDSVSKVEYTFGYKRNKDGKIRIYLHHSSLPYVPH